MHPSTPAHGCGSVWLFRHTIEAHLGIKAGETSADGLWTLTEVECLGACVNAPMIQVNDMFFEDLTPENTVALLDKLRDGKEVRHGRGRQGHGPRRPGAAHARVPFTTCRPPAVVSHPRLSVCACVPATLQVVVGPQNGRKHSLGPMGRTSLIEPITGPQCRELPPPFKPAAA